MKTFRKFFETLSNLFDVINIISRIITLLSKIVFVQTAIESKRELLNEVSGKDDKEKEENLKKLLDELHIEL